MFLLLSNMICKSNSFQTHDFICFLTTTQWRRPHLRKRKEGNYLPKHTTSMELLGLSCVNPSNFQVRNLGMQKMFSENRRYICIKAEPTPSQRKFPQVDQRPKLPWDYRQHQTALISSPSSPTYWTWNHNKVIHSEIQFPLVPNETASWILRNYQLSTTPTHHPPSKSMFKLFSLYESLYRLKECAQEMANWSF